MSDQSASQPPGWYYAQGDPPGTHRYWDGYQWQGGPQSVQSKPGTGVPPAGYGMVPGFAESSQATTALVLSILGIVCCGVLAPIGWYIGQQELNGIEAGRRDPTNRGTANAARVIGIIFTLVYGAAFVFYVLAAFAVRVSG